MPQCDPLAQDCRAGEACISTPGGTFVCHHDASGPDGAAGDACEYANACDPGLFCAIAASIPGCAGASGCCTPFCDLDAANDCPAGLPCRPLFSEGQAPATHEDVGGCFLPP